MQYTSKNADCQAVKSAIIGKEFEVLSRVAGIPESILDGKHHPCPKCGGNDRFRYDVAKKFVYCNQCFNKNNGDVIDAVRWITGDNLNDATNNIANYIVMDGRTDWGGAKEFAQQIFDTSPTKSKGNLCDIFQSDDPPVTTDNIPSLAGMIGDTPPKSVTYDYPDAVGNPAYRVKRLDQAGGKKDFYQQRFEGDKWVNGLIADSAGDRWIPYPYRLQRLLEPSTKSVIIVEGEKCADALQSLLDSGNPDSGIVVTTLAGGSNNAKHWGTVRNECNLDGMTIRILADNDKKGIEAANTAYEALHDITDDIAVVPFDRYPNGNDTPKGYDVADWIADSRGNGFLPDEAIATLVLGYIENHKTNKWELPEVETPGETSRQDDDEDEVIEFDEISQCPLDAFPKPLGSRSLEVARFTGVDFSIAVTAGLSAIGSAMGTNFEIEPFPGWTERAIFWGGVVVRSGNGKTPAIDMMIKPVWNYLVAKQVEYAGILSEFKALPANEQKEKECPFVATPLITDYTMEAIAKEVCNNETMGVKHGMLLYLDELSLMTDNLNAYKSGGKDLSSLLPLGDGKGVNVRRAGSNGLFAKTSHVCIIGGIQPTALERRIDGKKSPEFIERGLPQRFLWAVNQYPEKKVRRSEHESEYQNLFNALYEWNHDPIKFSLNKDAQNLFNEYEEKQDEERDRIDDGSATTDAISSYLAKSNSTVLKIALLFHVVEMIESNNPEAYLDCMAYITADTITRAIKVTEYYKSVFQNYILRKAFPQLDTPKSLKARILDLLAKAKEPMDARAIYKPLHSSAKVVKPQLTAIVSEGKVIAETRQGKQGERIFYSMPKK